MHLQQNHGNAGLAVVEGRPGKHLQPATNGSEPAEPEDFMAGEKSTLRIHDLELDTFSRTVKRAGRLILLTPFEYFLLKFLASRRGQIVTRRQIKEHLFKQGKHRSNVIEAHICYLRHKIDKGFDIPLILTLWGEGYMLRGETACCS